MSALSSLLPIDSTPSWTMTGNVKNTPQSGTGYYSSIISISHIKFRIIVLDNGHIVEYESPEKLLADKKSAFLSMAKDAGLAT